MNHRPDVVCWGPLNRNCRSVEQLRKSGVVAVERREATVPLVDVLQAHQAPRIIDYLSLDVEGGELQVLKDFPFERYVFRVMTIETRDKATHRALKHILQPRGYECIREIGYPLGERLWAHMASLPIRLNESRLRTERFAKQPTARTHAVHG